MRDKIVLVAMMGVQALVVYHWFWLPGSRALFIVAMTAGVLMAAMAVLEVLALVDMLRRDPADRVHRREFRDMAEVTSTWLVAVAYNIAFIALAVQAGVHWIAVIWSFAIAAEVAGVLYGRWRQRQAPPAGAAG